MKDARRGEGRSTNRRRQIAPRPQGPGRSCLRPLPHHRRRRRRRRQPAPPLFTFTAEPTHRRSRCVTSRVKHSSLLSYPRSPRLASAPCSRSHTSSTSAVLECPSRVSAPRLSGSGYVRRCPSCAITCAECAQRLLLTSWYFGSIALQNYPSTIWIIAQAGQGETGITRTLTAVLPANVALRAVHAQLAESRRGALETWLSEHDQCTSLSLLSCGQ
jgi:hypothetical protein